MSENKDHGMRHHRAEVIAAAHRIVIKIGSSSLTAQDGNLDLGAVRAIVEVVAQARAVGKEVLLVTSGAIAAGLAPLGLPRRPHDLATAQATASVGQGKLIAAYASEFARHGLTVGQVLLTAYDLSRRSHYGNAQRALSTLLHMGVVPVVNENDTVATAEIRFGDNDRLAALVAVVVKADLLLLLTDVDGLYTAKPGTPNARLISEVASSADLAGIDISRRGSGLGTGGMVTKLDAAHLATHSGVAVVLTAAQHARSVLAGDSVGTFFQAQGKTPGTRAAWLLHVAQGLGQLTIDAGAVTAIRRRASLLAAGVVKVSGEFVAGDPVDLVTPDGTLVARGFVSFGSEHIPAMLGLSTAELREKLGEEYAHVIVHADDLALLPRY